MSVLAPRGRGTLTVLDALVVTALCFGLFIWQSVRSVLNTAPAAAAGEVVLTWSDAAVLQSLFTELLLGGAALLYLRARRFDMAGLLPRPTTRDSLLGLGLFLLSYALYVVVYSVVALFVPPVATPMSFTHVSLAATLAFSVVNGVYEEVFLLGALVCGLRGFGLSVAIGLPLLVRVLYHVYQGPAGVISVVLFGLTMTLSYVITGRLWPAVWAHVLGDVVPMLSY